MTYTKPWEQGALKVTENGRYFSCGDTPFFWMGDTAWLLFHRLTEEETRNYLRNRKELGYNIILADFLHSPEQKNCAGDAALVNGDFNRINRDGGFWKHVDSVIRIAEELGLYMGILPVWGSNIVAGGSLNEENLDTYMDFILDRYHDASNIVWIVGGDVRGDVNPGLFERMGQRMKQDNPGRLVGYHPFGRTSSSLWFHEAKWLDFNLFQSGHRRYDQTELGMTMLQRRAASGRTAGGMWNVTMGKNRQSRYWTENPPMNGWCRGCMIKNSPTGRLRMCAGTLTGTCSPAQRAIPTAIIPSCSFMIICRRKGLSAPGICGRMPYIIPAARR